MDVSILVFMERPLQPMPRYREVYIEQAFQSLFLWNDLFNPLWLSQEIQQEVCFNPCFYGTTSSTNLVSNEEANYGMFQSLFLWNDLFNPAFSSQHPAPSRVSILVFMERPLQQKPCIFKTHRYREFQSLFLWNDLFNQITDDKETTIAGLFQSLFLWNDLFNDNHNWYCLTVERVSILVFMERPLQPCGGRLMTGCWIRFNPCFYGTTSSTPQPIWMVMW